MRLGRTGEAYFGDDVLLRDGDDAAAAAAEAGAAGGEAAAGSAAAAEAAAADAEDALIFAQELEGGDLEPVSAAQQTLVRCGAASIGTSRVSSPLRRFASCC